MRQYIVPQAMVFLDHLVANSSLFLSRRLCKWLCWSGRAMWIVGPMEKWAWRWAGSGYDKEVLQHCARNQAKY